MRIRPNQLATHLEGNLAPIYLVHGAEPLQIEESLDAVRAAARRRDHEERVVLHVDASFDWSLLRQYQDSLSLFAEKRLIDLRMAGAKAGKPGTQALVDYAERPNPDCLLLVSAGALEWREQKSRWFKALESAGASVQTWPVPAHQLPKWIDARARDRGMSLADDACQALAERAEGNLLAAAQEIDKLRLLHREQKITLADALASSGDSTRFHVFDLADAALGGDLPRTLKILRGLKEEGTEPIYASWALAREVRSLAAMSEELGRGSARGEVLARHRVRDKRRALVGAALDRHRPGAWSLMLRAAMRLDRVVKGAERGAPWDELEKLALMLGGMLLVPMSTYT